MGNLDILTELLAEADSYVLEADEATSNAQLALAVIAEILGDMREALSLLVAQTQDRPTCTLDRGTAGLMHVTTGHCSACGAENVKPARYCSHCGAVVVAQ